MDTAFAISAEKVQFWSMPLSPMRHEDFTIFSVPESEHMSSEMPATENLTHRPVVGLSLHANFSWTFFGNALYASTQWGLLILLTKLFEPEVFGQYALALSIVTPIFIGSALQLRAVQVTDVKDTSPFADYLLLRVVTNLLALLCIVIINLLGLVPSHLFKLTFLLGLNQAVLLMLDIYQGARQKQERMDLVAISQVRIGFVSLGIAALTAFLFKDVLLVVAAMLLARTVSVLIFDVRGGHAPTALSQPFQVGLAIRKILHVRRLLPLTRTAFPLGIVMLLISLYSNIPRYFLASYGTATVGFFAAVASLVALQDMITGALGQSAAPRLSRHYAASRRAYVRLLLQVMIIFLLLGLVAVIAAVLLSDQILTLLFRPEYAQFANVFVWLLVAKVVLNVKSAIGYGMTAARVFRAQMWIEGLSIASLCLFAWMLVPTWAGLGAAWAMLASACVGLTTGAFVLGKALYLQGNTQDD